MHLALFDFDHTITTCDTYSRFLRSVATPRQKARAKWTVGPWLLGYRLGLVPAAGIRRRATHAAFAGRDAAQIASLATRYAEDQLPQLVRADAMRRIDWHRNRGHRIVVVSGSLDLYLRPWCERHELELLCNRLESRDGRLTGRYDGGDLGPRKAEEIRVRYALGDYPRIHAYGDSREDRGMLALAHERWYAGKRIA